MALLLSALAATLAVAAPVAVALLEGGVQGPRLWVPLTAAGVASLLLWALLLRVWVRPWRQVRDSVAQGDGAVRPGGRASRASRASVSGALAGVARLRRQQLAAAEHQQRTEALLDALPHGVLVVDEHRQVRLANRRVAGMLGGAGVRAAADAPPLQPLIEAAIRTRSGGEGDVPGVSGSRDAPAGADGEEETVLLAEVSPYRWQGDAAALVVLSDVTRMRRLERVRRDFVANVSHELRTPITAISGFIETLLDGRMYASDHARRFLEIAQRQTGRMDAIIGDLLVLTRLEADEEDSDIHFATAAVAPVVENAVQLCRAAADRSGIRLEVRCDAELTCRMSSQLVEQALVNLVDNAIRYDQRGATVQVAAVDEERALRIAVSDTGAGIPTDQHDRIFERFYRIDPTPGGDRTGTGLGLAIVRHIARVHGGAVELVSELGAGSTFSLLLPH